MESELARFALEDQTGRRKFCRYDIQSKAFTLVSPEEVRVKLDMLAFKSQQEAMNIVAKNTNTSSIPLGQDGKPANPGSKTMARLGLPARLIELIKTLVIKAAIKKSALTTKIWEQKKENQQHNEYHANATDNKETDQISIHSSIIKHEDTYISVGLDWDDKDIPRLKHMKKEIGFKVILCCYDLIPILKPGLAHSEEMPRLFMDYIRTVVNTADHIFCISQSTKQDLLQFIAQQGLPLPEIGVAYLGTDIPAPAIQIQPSHEIEENIGKNSYILFVSTIERRKGHDTLYRAYTRLIEQGHTDLPLLVFVGMPGWGVSDLLMDIHRTIAVSKFIKFIHHVTDFDLDYLYRNCMFTVFPSVYEGWGLPVAESLAYGKFCLASNISSLPEVGEKFCDYLDPWDIPGWAEKIGYYANDKGELLEKERIIAKEHRPKSWRQTCMAFFEVADTP